MQIEVKLFATFRKGRFIKQNMDVPQGTSIGDILEILGIDEDETGVIFVNGRHASVSYGLEDSDVLSVFPLVGGG